MCPFLFFSSFARAGKMRFATAAPSSVSVRFAAGLALSAGLGAVCLGALGCGNDNGKKGSSAGTLALADSASLSVLARGGLDIPTGVAVRDGVAWVVEAQFDHYAPFGGDGMPGQFRLVGVPLDGSAAQFITLPPNYFPEGITATGAGRLFVGSVASGAIYTVAPGDTTATQFLAAGTLPKPGVLGMSVSKDGGLLWVCNTDTANAHGDIVGIGVGDGQVKATHPMPDSANGAFCNDITIAADGTLWATESFGGRIFRISTGDLPSNTPATVWLEAPALAPPAAGAFGVNGLALVNGQLLLVNSSSGKLLTIDPKLATPTSDDLREIPLTAPGQTGTFTMANPDGMTRVSDTEVLIVENGFGLSNGKDVLRIDLATK
jgi:sugar lactone lactonase YvrE